MHSLAHKRSPFATFVDKTNTDLPFVAAQDQKRRIPSPEHSESILHTTADLGLSLSCPDFEPTPLCDTLDERFLAPPIFQCSPWHQRWRPFPSCCCCLMKMILAVLPKIALPHVFAPKNTDPIIELPTILARTWRWWNFAFLGCFRNKKWGFAMLFYSSYCLLGNEGVHIIIYAHTKSNMYRLFSRLRLKRIQNRLSWIIEIIIQ